MLDRITTAETVTETARPVRGRRLSWKEFTALTGRPAPVAANNNEAIRAEMHMGHGGDRRSEQVQKFALERDGRKTREIVAEKAGFGNAA